jgi:polyhydroxyalkanoate synthesis regulator phasin
MSFLEGGGIGQLLSYISIPTIIMFIFIQLRSYKKDQRELAEKNRAAITKEITDKTDTVTTTIVDKTQNLFDKIEARLEAIKVASIITKEDINILKQQVNDLRHYVDSLDKSGTVEWQKTKPFIIEKIEDLNKRIDELDNRFTFKMTEIAQKEIKKDKNAHPHIDIIKK